MGRKKVNIIESSEGLPEGFLTQNMLKDPDKEKCLIPQANLEIIKKNLAMPYETEFFTHPDLTSECYSPDWVCFPEYPFVIGLKVSFPKLITRFFVSSKLNYAQIMPQGWRCLQTLVRLSAETELEVGLEEFAYTTEIRGFGLGRFGFRVKTGGAPILNDNSDPADRGWRNKFFFARRNTLVSEEGAISNWRSQVAKLSVIFAYKDGTEENVRKIYELDPLVRSFKAFPVLFSADPKEEINPEEALPEPIKMSTATRSKASVSVADLLAKAMMVVKNNKPPTPYSAVSSSEAGVSKKKEETKKRKLTEAEATDVGGDLNVEKTREKFKAAMKEFTDKVSEIMIPFMDQVDNLKIKAAKYSHEAEEKKKETKKYADEVGKLKKANGNLEKELAAVRAEKEKENEAHVKELDAAKVDFEFHATKTVLEARIQLIEEYRNGQATTWDVEEEKRTLECYIGDPADGEEVESLALEAINQLVEDANNILSIAVVKQPEEKNQGEETNTTPAAAGQEV